MRAIRPRTRGAADESIITIDNDSAPRILFYGEDFLCEDLPVGTRVIYPRKPIEGLLNPKAAIRYALNHPLEMEPLHALLVPGTKVTIAVDVVSLLLPPRATSSSTSTSTSCPWTAGTSRWASGCTDMSR